jgi:hypothetical protein
LPIGPPTSQTCRSTVSFSSVTSCSAYTAAGSPFTASSRKAYQEFLGTWKEADADLPILRAAKQEYAAIVP